MLSTSVVVLLKGRANRLTGFIRRNFQGLTGHKIFRRQSLVGISQTTWLKNPDGDL
jgi:hypothetical protein